MATEVGVGYISIVPEVKGFSAALQRELGPGLTTAGHQAGAQVGDGMTDGVDKSLHKNKKRLGDMGNMMSGLLMGGAIASAAVFGKTLVDAASRQEQALGAMDAVFKANGAAMRENAKAATELGLSTSDYAEAATQLGAQLQNLGMAQDELAPTSDKLVRLASDMAAQFGGTTMEAVQSLTSAFRGEMDPIERYGVSLNETKLKAQMAATGQDKMRASLSLIQQQLGMTGTIGAWNRELDTTASKTQVASAKWEDAKAKLGEVLTPVVVFAAEKLSILMDKFTKLDPATRNMALAVAGLTAVVWLAVIAVNALNLSLLANPITWVILAAIGVVIVLVATFWRLWNSSEAFRENVRKLWEGLKELWRESEPLRQKLVEAFDKVGEALGRAFDSFMKNVWPDLRDVAPGVFAAIAASLMVSAVAATILADMLAKAFDYYGKFRDGMKASSPEERRAVAAALMPVAGPFAPVVALAARASGGPIFGAGSKDTVPAMLTPGEFVLNRTMVAQAGGIKALESWRTGGQSPGGVNVGTIVVNNPLPESAADSLPRAIRRMSWVGVPA